MGGDEKKHCLQWSVSKYRPTWNSVLTWILIVSLWWIILMEAIDIVCLYCQMSYCDDAVFNEWEN